MRKLYIKALFFPATSSYKEEINNWGYMWQEILEFPYKEIIF